MDPWSQLKRWLEILNGAQEIPVSKAWDRWGWLATGVWWGVLAALIASFCGQTSRFIYIDF